MHRYLAKWLKIKLINFRRRHACQLNIVNALEYVYYDQKLDLACT